mmetsp:Transcript_32410/g.85203  ORF Transcript_32410/g.85203 Transcript_32410/m.85203 type:complete len:245 (-) Transcript_32410:2003-2737(-)
MGGVCTAPPRPRVNVPVRPLPGRSSCTATLAWWSAAPLVVSNATSLVVRRGRSCGALMKVTCHDRPPRDVVEGGRSISTDMPRAWRASRALSRDSIEPCWNPLPATPTLTPPTSSWVEEGASNWMRLVVELLPPMELRSMERRKLPLPISFPQYPHVSSHAPEASAVVPSSPIQLLHRASGSCATLAQPLFGLPALNQVAESAHCASMPESVVMVWMALTWVALVVTVCTSSTPPWQAVRVMSR